MKVNTEESVPESNIEKGCGYLFPYQEKKGMWVWLDPTCVIALFNQCQHNKFDFWMILSFIMLVYLCPSKEFETSFWIHKGFCEIKT